MLAAGPSVAWAEALLPDSAAGVMLEGYQSENSPGAKLLDLAESGGEFELPASSGFPARVAVNARVGRFGLGAHATADELVSTSAEVVAKAVMLVHGTPAGQAILANRLRKAWAASGVIRRMDIRRMTARRGGHPRPHR